MYFLKSYFTVRLQIFKIFLCFNKIIESNYQTDNTKEWILLLILFRYWILIKLLYFTY